MRRADTGRLQVLLAAALFSTGGAAIKACSLSSWQVASFRSGVAALVLCVALPEARRRWGVRAVAVGSAYAATMVLFVVANKLTTAANTIFLQSTAPLYVALLAPWVLGERFRVRELGFMLVLAAGMALFFVGNPPRFPTAPDPLRGDVLAACSGVTWALTLLGLRWLAARAETAASSDLGAALVIGNLLAFFVVLPVALPLAPAVSAPTAALDGALIAYLGTCQIGLAYVFLSRGVAEVPALEVSLLLLLEPVLNAVWAWLIHGEEPGGLALAGGAIILTATAWKAWRDAPSER